MTVEKLAKRLALQEIHIADPDREVTGGYAGDLLSWVMGRVTEGDAWVTIMTNINVIAVASLSDVSCVILAEGVNVAQDVLDAAKTRGINLLSGTASTYALCNAVGQALNGDGV